MSAPESAPQASSSFLDLLPPSCEVLRDYQRKQLLELAEAMRAGYRRIIAQLPTGAGKTHMIAGITAAAREAHLSILIIATRTRLVRQIHERLEAFGVAHGVVAAQLRSMLDRFQAVQVASADTLYRRCLGSGHMPLPPADVVIFDECHLGAADSRLKLLEQYPQATVIGFSATPARRSGRSLSAVFDHLIAGPSIPELIKGGMLVRPRIFSVPVISAAELSELPKDTANDYSTGAAAALMSRPKLTGDVRGNWLRIANGKRTLVFCCDKAHGAQLVQEFQSSGVATELLTDEDGEATREAVVARLEAGETLVVVNCFLLSYGADIPSVECIVLARPTRSVVQYLQMVGRAMRPAPGKEFFTLIDHGRVVESLGLPTIDFGWSLDADRNVNSEAAEATVRATIAETPRTCPECQHVWLVSERGGFCESCGWAPAPRPKAVHASDADLMELGGSVLVTSMHSPQVAEFFRQALDWYARRWPQRWKEKPKSGRWWAWVKTRERFEIPESARMPRRFWDSAPIPATPEAAGWVHSRHIRDVKAREWVHP